METTFLNRFWICCQKRTFLILFWLVWYTKNLFSSFSGQPSTSGERDIWTSWFRLLHMAIPRIPTVGKKKGHPKSGKGSCGLSSNGPRKSRGTRKFVGPPCPISDLRSKRRWSTSPLSRRRRRPATNQVWDLMHESQK